MALVMLLTLYGHIKTAQQRTLIHSSGDNWYTGRSFDGLLHLYSDEGPGGLHPRPVPSLL